MTEPRRTQRDIVEHIAAKQATHRRTVDNQGRPIDEPREYVYDSFGRLVGPLPSGAGDDAA